MKKLLLLLLLLASPAWAGSNPPPGANTNVIYNKNSQWAADSGFTYNSSGATTQTGISTALSSTATGNTANQLPSGTTGQRPSPANGMLRYNSTVPQVEAYYSGAWNALGGGGGNPGGSTNDIQYKSGTTTFGGITLTNGQLVIGQTGSTPLAKTMSGDAILAASGALTLASAVKKFLGGYVTVTEPPYNAVCDGTTDDSTAIQSAWDTEKDIWIPASCKVKNLVPPNNSSISGPFSPNYDLASTGRLVGASGGASIFSINGKRSVAITNLELDCASVTSMVGVTGGGRLVYGNHLSVQNCPGGGVGDNVNITQNFYCTDCNLFGNGTNLQNIEDSFYYGNISASTGTTDNIYLGPGNGNNEIRGTIEFAGGEGLRCFQCNRLKVDAIFDHNTSNGLYCDGGTQVDAGSSIFYRNGRTGTYSHEAHIFSNGTCQISGGSIQTQTGVDDGGGGSTTPKYVLEINATTDKMVFTGNDFTGYVTAPVNYNAIPTDFILAHNKGAVDIFYGKNSANIYYGQATVNAEVTSNSDTANSASAGTGALAAMTGTSNFSTAFGVNALHAVTTGTNNTAFGYQALNAVTTGGSNTAIGNQALAALTTGSFNMALGYQALNSATTGSNNVAMGLGALFGTTIGQANVALGKQAGNAITTGNNNTVIGYQVGQNTLATGSNNILIGVDNSTDAASSSTSNSAVFKGTGTSFLSATATNGTAPIATLGGTAAVILPTGTTAQRPTAVAGMIRYNSDTPGLEAYYSSAWNALGAGGGGGTITLGTSAAATNPQRSGQATTGFYSDTTNDVKVGANSQPVEEWAGVASAVDWMNITNAATANPAQIIYAPTGSDTNVGMMISPKGSGGVTIGSSTSGANSLKINTNQNVALNIVSSSTAGPTVTLDATGGGGHSMQFFSTGNSGGLQGYFGIFDLTETSLPFSVFGGTSSSAGAFLEMYAAAPITWSSTSSGVGTRDTGLSRASAGVVDVGNGTQADTSGTLQAAVVNIGTTSAQTNSKLTINGHITTQQTTAPVASSCGSGTVDTASYKSTDQHGGVTGITAATACTITFNQAFPYIPSCSASGAGIASAVSSTSTAAVTFSMAALTGTLVYQCQ